MEKRSLVTEKRGPTLVQWVLLATALAVIALAVMYLVGDAVTTTVESLVAHLQEWWAWLDAYDLPRW